jgi:NTE family protein
VVEIEEPQAAAGWYSDGGVRLNAPLIPALTLGADRVVVIGLNSSTTPAAETTHAAASRRPDAIDGVAQLLQVVLADQLAEDVATLATVNETLESSGSLGTGKRTGRRRRSRVPYIFIAPCDRLEIGRLARKVYKERYTGVGGIVRDSNVAGLGWLVNAGHSAVHGELLSCLFLAHEFIEELIAHGRRDAERWIEAKHDAGLWQVGRLPG